MLTISIMRLKHSAVEPRLSTRTLFASDTLRIGMPKIGESDATLSREPFAQQPERYKGRRSSRHDSFPGLETRPSCAPRNGSDV